MTWISWTCRSIISDPVRFRDHDVLDLMYPICFVHKVCFHSFVAERKLKRNKSLLGDVDLIFSRPCSLGRVKNYLNTNHYCMKIGDLTTITSTLNDLKNCEGHRHIFCSAVQSWEWNCVLAGKIEDEQLFGNGDDELINMKYVVQNLFHHYNRSLGSYHHSTAARRAYCTIVDEILINSRRIGMMGNSVLSH